MDNPITFNPKTKLDLFNILISDNNTFSNVFAEREGILDFLQNIWDLNEMPSTDTRFNNAHGDVFQHMINNDDWELEYLFIERFKLLEYDEKYKIFLETLVLPKFRKNEDEIIKYALLINQFIEKDECKLILKEYDENDSPIYKITVINDEENIPFDLKQNDIPFYFTKNPIGRSDRSNSHKLPKTFPSFALVFNKGWNDYLVLSSFSLFYYDDKEVSNYIGEMKIIVHGEMDTSLHLNEKFNVLSEIFCSLGNNINYYFNLKRILGRNFESLLYALKDAAFFPEIADKFERQDNFIKSIIRYNESERLLREAKYIIYDFDLSNLYSFKYQFSPLYSDSSVEVDFAFNNKISFQNRIYALIGKNGTGKTQLITSLPKNISDKNDNIFSPRTPLFSKIIAVSYNIFDRINFPPKTSSFNYVFCGMRNDKQEIISEKGLVLRFHYSWKKIDKLERINQWREILLTFLDEELINDFIVKKEEIKNIRNLYEVNIDNFTEIRNKLSSGQASILFIITEIVANIRFDSLLLFDEPETHLHPNAITQLMNTIYELVNKFESFCIIATHSPLVVRELFSKNVYVVERHENTPSVRKIPLESFGENLSVLTEEIFGNKDIIKQYKSIIRKLVNDGKSYDELLAILESDDIPLSLNARLYIKSLTEEKND